MRLYDAFMYVRIAKTYQILGLRSTSTELLQIWVFSPTELAKRQRWWQKRTLCTGALHWGPHFALQIVYLYRKRGFILWEKSTHNEERHRIYNISPNCAVFSDYAVVDRTEQEVRIIFEGNPNELLLSDGERWYLVNERATRKKQLLIWFNRRAGILLRPIVPSHTASSDKERQCALCNVNNGRGYGSMKPKIKCSVCEEKICTKAREHTAFCW